MLYKKLVLSSSDVFFSVVLLKPSLAIPGHIRGS